MEFSTEQQLAYNKYIEGNNIFITGPKIKIGIHYYLLINLLVYIYIYV